MPILSLQCAACESSAFGLQKKLVFTSVLLACSQSCSSEGVRSMFSFRYFRALLPASFAMSKWEHCWLAI